MKNLRKHSSSLPSRLLVPVVLTLDGAIGYVDYLTSDYSILMFYAIPIALAAWFRGVRLAAVVSFTAGGTRFLSDYFSYANSNVRYLTSLEDLLYLLIVGLLVSALKRFLDDMRFADDERVGEIVKAET